MKLLRVGDAGAEIPAVLIDDDHALDLSSAVADFDPAFFAGDGPAALAAAVASKGDSLPQVSLQSARVGSCIARPGQILGIGLNYRDHVAPPSVRSLCSSTKLTSASVAGRARPRRKPPPP